MNVAAPLHIRIVIADAGTFLNGAYFVSLSRIRDLKEGRGGPRLRIFLS